MTTAYRVDPVLLSQLLAHPDVIRAESRGASKAWCPAHDDKRLGGNPSLRISSTGVKCWSEGCGFTGASRLAELWGIQRPRDASSGLVEGRYQAIYDYHASDGSLVFQVCRKPGKDFPQRRPDPDRAGAWIYNLKGVDRVLYHLPDIIAAPQDAWIYVVEGEKDADTCRSHGLVATTNPGGAASKGSRKWLSSYTQSLQYRRVAVLGDNDRAGRTHVSVVSSALLKGNLRSVRTPDLGLEEDGADVSDWFAAGHTADELQALVDAAPDLEVEDVSGEEEDDSEDSGGAAGAVRQSIYYAATQSVLQRMRADGRFMRSMADGKSLYLHREAGRLFSIHKDDVRLMEYLDSAWSIGQKDSIYPHVLSAAHVEAQLRGDDVEVQKNFYYSEADHKFFMPLSEVEVLEVSGDGHRTVRHGDGTPTFDVKPGSAWEYDPRVGDEEWEIVFEGCQWDRHDMEPEEYSEMVRVWAQSLAFTSLMYARPILLLLGGSSCGKTTLARLLGRLLVDPAFNVDAIERDGESDFWTTVASQQVVAYDNADSKLGWMEDALARVSTSSQRRKRALYTDDVLHSSPTECHIMITARTPFFRREDVASRLLVARMARIEARRSEFEIQRNMRLYRSRLLSSYVNGVRRVLAGGNGPIYRGSDPRLADWIGIVRWIGEAYGGGREEVVGQVIDGLTGAQAGYATEYDEVMYLIRDWVSQSPEQSMGSDVLTNAGRWVRASVLHREILALAAAAGKNSIPQLRTLHGFGMHVSSSIESGAWDRFLVCAKDRRGGGTVYSFESAPGTSSTSGEGM